MRGGGGREEWGEVGDWEVGGVGEGRGGARRRWEKELVGGWEGERGGGDGRRRSGGMGGAGQRGKGGRRVGEGRGGRRKEEVRGKRRGRARSPAGGWRTGGR